MVDRRDFAGWDLRFRRGSSSPAVINSSNKGSTSLRNDRMFSANANFTFYTCSDQTACLANSYGGTILRRRCGGLHCAGNQQAVASGGRRLIHQPDHYAQN